MYIPLIASAALALTMPAMSAQARDAIETENFRVEYRDLNLATPEGQRLLDQRVDQAARMVCGIGDVQTGSRIASRGARDCYRDATHQARNSVAAAVRIQTSKGG